MTDKIPPTSPDYNPDAPVVIEYYIMAPQQNGVKKTAPNLALTLSTTTDEHDSPSHRSTLYSPLKRRAPYEFSSNGPFLPLQTLLKIDKPSEPKYLAALHPHPLDSRIKFYPPHIYVVDYNEEPHSRYPPEFNLSASTWAKNQFPEFREDEVIERMIKLKSTTYMTHYRGMGPEEIKKKWGEASEQGIFYHLLFENHCNKTIDLARSKYAHLKPVQQYLKWRRNHFDNEFEEFRTEIRLSSNPELRIVGTADLLAVRKNHPPPHLTNGVLTLSIFDWKNKYNFKRDNLFEKGFGPCRKMGNCNASKDFIQLNIYAWLLTTFYSGWKYNGYFYNKVSIEFMKLVIVHDLIFSDEAIVCDVPNLSYIIKEMVKERKIALQKMKIEYDLKQKERQQQDTTVQET